VWVELWVIAKTAGHILAELWWFILLAVIIASVMSIPSILAVMVLFRRQALYIYVTVGFMGALVIGYTYNLF
jgi:hypothetical protein